MIIQGKRLNSSICPLDGTMTGTLTLSYGENESNGNEGAHPKAPGLESHNQMQFNVIPRTFIGGGGESCSSAEVQSAYSTDQADKAEN